MFPSVSHCPHRPTCNLVIHVPVLVCVICMLTGSCNAIWIVWLAADSKEQELGNHGDHHPPVEEVPAESGNILNSEGPQENQEAGHEKTLQEMKAHSVVL